MFMWPRFRNSAAHVLPIIVVATFLIILSQVAHSKKTLSEKPPLTNDLFNHGEKLYGELCSSCHGVNGDGAGKASYLLFPKPRDFTDGEFRLVSTSDQVPTDRDLFNSITRGMAGSSMPPWDYLPETDRWSLVYYVRYLSELGMKKKFGEISADQLKKGLSWEDQKQLSDPGFGDASRISVPKETRATRASIRRGKKLFIEACAGCHGVRGKGDGQQEMVDSSGLPTKPRDLTAGIFKGSGSSEDLWYRIQAGLPGSPMPGYQGAYKDSQIWDLIHYIQTLPPKGAEEKARLRRQTIRAQRGNINLDPAAKAWGSVKPIEVALAPLWWRDKRIATVQVRAVHDGDAIAIHMSWKENKKDDAAITPQSFSDGAAIQLSTAKNPPLFSMGDRNAPVTLWHWKASWQSEKEGWSDIESQYPNTATDFYESQPSYQYGSPFETRESKTKEHDPRYVTAWGAGNPLSNPNRASAAEEATAEGFGTLTSQKSEEDAVEAKGVWRKGQWSVVFHRALNAKGKKRLQLASGASANIAFAIWDGGVRDRDGQKEISNWNQLILE